MIFPKSSVLILRTITRCFMTNVKSGFNWTAIYALLGFRQIMKYLGKLVIIKYFGLNKNILLFYPGIVYVHAVHCTVKCWVKDLRGFGIKIKVGLKFTKLHHHVYIHTSRKCHKDKDASKKITQLIKNTFYLLKANIEQSKP